MAPNHSGDVNGQRGASRIGCLLGILFLVLAGYAGVQFAGTEIDYQTLKSEVEDLARVARETGDAAIREAIANEAARLGLPAAAGRPAIRRVPSNRIQITVQYPDSLTLFNRWYWVRQRQIAVDRTY